MRDNSNDRTVERSYIQKWQFLIREHDLVKAKKHTRFRFVQDFYNFHGTNRQTFANYYNRYRHTLPQTWALQPDGRLSVVAGYPGELVQQPTLLRAGSACVVPAHRLCVLLHAASPHVLLR